MNHLTGFHCRFNPLPCSTFVIFVRCNVFSLNGYFSVVLVVVTQTNRCIIHVGGCRSEYRLHRTSGNLRYARRKSHVGMREKNEKGMVHSPVDVEMTAAAAIHYAHDCICVRAPNKHNPQHLGYVQLSRRSVHATVT